MFSKTIRNPNSLKEFLKKLENDSDEDDLPETPTTGREQKMKLFDDDDDDSEKLEKSDKKYFFKKRKTEEKPVNDENNDNFLETLKSRNEITKSRLKQQNVSFDPKPENTASEGQLTKLLNLITKDDLESGPIEPSNEQWEKNTNLNATRKAEVDFSEEDILAKSPIVDTNKNNFGETRPINQNWELSPSKSDFEPRTPIVDTNKNNFGETRDINQNWELSPSKSDFEPQISNSELKSRESTPNVRSNIRDIKSATLIISSPKRKNKYNKKSIYSLPDLSKTEDTCDYTSGKDVVDMAYMSWYRKKTMELRKLQFEENKLRETEQSEKIKKKIQLEKSSKTAFESWKKNTDTFLKKKRQERELAAQKEKEEEIKRNENIIKAEKSFNAWIDKKKREPRPMKKKEELKQEKTDEEMREIEKKRKNMEKRFKESLILKKRRENEKFAEEQKNEKLKLRKELIAQKNFEDWMEKKEMDEPFKRELKVLTPWMPPRRTIPFNK